MATMQRSVVLLALLLVASAVSSSGAAVPPPKDLADVCNQCKKVIKYTACGSTIANRCLDAIHAYINTSLGVQEDICTCSNLVADQLLGKCPGINPSVAYLNNCNKACLYGEPCPVKPALYALISAANVVVGGAGRKDAGLVTLSYEAKPTGANQLCFQVARGYGLPRLNSVTISSGVAKQLGPVVVTLYTPRTNPPNGAGCVNVSLALWTNITASPGSFYAQGYAGNFPNGLARGQLVETPKLFSAIRDVSEKLTLRGLLSLSFKDYAVSYEIAVAPPKNASLTAAAVANARGGSALFSFFGPGIAPPSYRNGLTPPRSNITALLSNPAAYFFRLSTAAGRAGELRGTFTESVAVAGYLTGAGERPPTKVTGRASFTATVGGGSVCYAFVLGKGIGTLTLAAIREGNATTSGAILVSLFGNGVRPTSRACVAIDSESAGHLVADTSNHYVEIFTRENPNGAIRGQLVLKL